MPSTSHTVAPSRPGHEVRACRPRAVNARTGLFTPPGMTRWARSNSASLAGPTEPTALAHRPITGGELLGEVGEDDVGAGPLDRGEVLEGHGVAVDPAALGGRLHHRVLAGHVVRRDGHVDLGAGGGDHVEVGQRRLHHHHVGALGDVGADLGQRLAGVGRVLLVALAVAAVGDRARRPRRGTGRRARRRTWRRRRGSRCRRGRRRRGRRGWRRPGRPSSRSAPRCRRRRRPGPAPRWRRCSRVASLSTSPSAVTTPQWPWVGVLVDAQVGDEHERRRPPRRAGRPGRSCTMPSGSQAPEPSASFVGGHAEQDHRRDAEVGQLGHLLAERLAGVLHHAGQAGDGLRLGRCPRARTAARRGRRPTAGSRPRGGAGPGCGAAGGAGAGGRPPRARLPGGASRRAVEVGDREVERAESTTRSACGEVVGAGDAAGHGHRRHAGRLGRRRRRGRSPRGRRLRRVGAEVGAGPQVHVGRRLADAADEVGADQRREVRVEPEPPDVALEPARLDDDAMPSGDAGRDERCRRAARPRRAAAAACRGSSGPAPRRRPRSRRGRSRRRPTAAQSRSHQRPLVVARSCRRSSPTPRP